MSNPDDARAALKHAFQLIKAGEKQQARKIIGEFLKVNPRSADGWYLAALVTDEPEKKLKIVERVLEINPQHTAGKKLFDELTVNDDVFSDLLRETEELEPELKPKSAPTSALPKGASDFLKGRAFWIAITVLVMLIIFGSVFVLGQSRGELLGIVFRASITPSPTNTPLPTHTPTPTYTPTPSSTPTYTPSPTLDFTETAAVEYQKIETAVAMTLVAGGNSPNGQQAGVPTIMIHLDPLTQPTSTPDNRMVKDVVPFDYAVRDAAYDPALQKIIMISENSQLHIYDPETNNDQTVDLSRETLSLSVSPDGMFAAIGHDALISYVDLQNAKLVKTLDVPVRINHLVLAGSSWVYIEDQSSFETIVAVDLNTGRQVKGAQVSGDTVVRLSPDGRKIYGANRGISPDDIYRIDIGPQGFADPNQRFAKDSPYHGDYGMCGDLWFSQDSQRIFTASGAVFRSSDDPAQDMTYNGSISQDFRVLSYMAHLQADGIVLGLTGAEGHGDKLGVWDYENLTLKNMITLPNYDAKRASYGRFVFVNPTSMRYYIIVWTFKSAGVFDFGLFAGDISELNRADLQLSAAQPTSLPQPIISQDGVIGLNFNLIDAEYSTALDRIIAVSDSPNQLHIYNPVNHSDTIVDLAASPANISVSPDGLSAAVSHSNPATVSIVDLKTAQVTTTLRINEYVYDLVLGGNGWVYFSSKETDGTFPRLYAVDIRTNQEISGPIAQNIATLRLHLDNKKLYGANQGISPSGFFRTDISPDGFTNPIPFQMIRPPGRRSYYICGNLWFSNDGQRIFTACGNVFHSSDTPKQDMTSIGSMDKTQSIDRVLPDVYGITSLIEVRGFLVGISRVKTTDPETMPVNQIVVWNDIDLTLRKYIPLDDWSVNGKRYPANGRFIFANAAGTQYYVITQAHEEAGLLHDFGIITGNISDL